MIVCLGATAAQALLGSGFRVTQHRGEILRDSGWAPWLLATIHPSAILRVPAEEREATYAQFVKDLRLVAAAANEDRRGKKTQ